MNSFKFDIGVLNLINDNQAYFTVTILILCLILIALDRYFNPNHLSNLFSFKINLNQLKQTTSYSRLILLQFNFLLIASLIIYDIVKYISEDNFFDNIIYYFSILGLVFIYHLFKILSLYFISLIFSRKHLFDLDNWFKFTNSLGVISLPIILLFIFQSNSYKPTFYLTALIILSIVFLIFLIKNLRSAIVDKISFLYIILYLCTLEILPILLILQYFID